MAEAYPSFPLTPTRLSVLVQCFDVVSRNVDVDVQQSAEFRDFYDTLKKTVLSAKAHEEAKGAQGNRKDRRAAKSKAAQAEA